MKALSAMAAAGLVAILGVQQYQLNSIAESVSDIKADMKLITQDPAALTSYSEKDEACLARNIYYEAGIESEHGKQAVAQTTMNRLKTGRWGRTICEVVYAKAQFSWTLKRKLEKPRGQAWDDSLWIAHRALRGDHLPALSKAIFYHAEYVKPKWRDPKAKIAQIGQHIFYTRARKA